MSKLIVVCGHGNGDPGASGYDYDGAYYEEAERVRALGQRIKELGGDEVILADTSKNFYWDTRNGKGYYNLDVPAGCPIVELHMDSAGSGARGAHVIIRGTSDEYDDKLAAFISEFFPGRANKLVSRTDLCNVNANFRLKNNYRLVENGFISDPNDLDKFNNSIDEIALGYLRVFGILEDEDMATITPGDVWGYAWYNDKGENTAPGGNMYNCAVYNYLMTEELLKRVVELSANQGANTEEIAEAIKKSVEEKFASYQLKLVNTTD